MNRETPVEPVPTAAFRATAWGLYGGACAGVVDALSIAQFGTRSPVYGPALGLLSLVLLGAIAGGVLDGVAAILGPRGRRARDAAGADVLLAFFGLQGGGLVLLERQEWRIGTPLALGLVGTAVVGLTLGPLVLERIWRRPARWFAPRLLVLVLFLYSWVPLTEQVLASASEARTWTTMGLTFGLTVVVAGGLGFVRATTPLCAASALRRAAVVAVLGSSVASGWLHRRHRPPLEPPSPVSTAPSPDDRRPNLLLVVLDTTRKDHLTPYGYERDTTPRLAEFAKSALRFDRAVSTSSWTLPAHASLFTGLYPSEHGAHMRSGTVDHAEDVGQRPDPEALPAHPLSLEHVTLAEVLEENGYDTAGVVANTAFLDRTFGLQQGFRHWDDRPRRDLGTMSAFSVLEWVRALLDRFEARVMIESAVYRRADVIRREALSWLDRREDSAPFFLFLNFMDAHGPFYPPPPFDEMFEGYSHDLLRVQELGRVTHEVMGSGRSLSEEEAAHFVSRYDGELAFLDQELGLLFDGLRERGRFEDTWIVVTADHGESFGERGFLGHGNCLHGEEIDIPLLVRPPGGTEPRGIDEWTSLRDLPRMLGHAAGVELPESMSGPTPMDEAGGPLAELFQRDSHVRVHGERFARDLRALHSGNYRLVLSSVDGESLYDLCDDPQEERPLERVPAEIGESVGALKSWLSTLPEARTNSMESMSPALREALERLGYLDDSH